MVKIKTKIMLEATACLVLMAVIVMLNGCASERVVYRTVNVAVPVLPDVPPELLTGYNGSLPVATADGAACFATSELEALQNWMLWHKTRVDQFRSLLDD
ncbi:MAG: hypothetical protein Tp138OMZ00d2C19078241_34 [Prokaryotic dsDNA virus sp.]|nr:MAG: hypothetical protein Tp138OMZ00d2C19078241_34 [Prokaryotic dsDNA virus sp.]